jgi:hypothetical protein
MKHQIVITLKLVHLCKNAHHVTYFIIFIQWVLTMPLCSSNREMHSFGHFSLNFFLYHNVCFDNWYKGVFMIVTKFKKFNTNTRNIYIKYIELILIHLIVICWP